MKDNIFVNGPINVVRLEGKVGQTKKILYAFMDFHMDVSVQTKCDDVRSKDMNTYLAETFDEISKQNKTYDFFLEQYPTFIPHGTQHPTHQYQSKLKYIWEVSQLFTKSFTIDEKNMVGQSKNFKNVRLHYMDIRDYVQRGEDYPLEYKINDHIHKIIVSGYIIPDDIIHIKDGLAIEMANVTTIYDIFYKDSIAEKVELKSSIPKTYEELQKYTPDDKLNRFKSFVNKLRTRYKHDDIKRKINKIIELRKIRLNYL